MNKSKKPDKSADDVVHELRKIVQEFDDRITLDNLRLGERYLRNQIQFIIHFTFATCIGDAVNFVAVFHNAKTVAGDQLKYLIEKPSDLQVIRSRGVGNQDVPWHGSANEQVTMLVNNVKVVEKPQGAILATPALVRLGLPNEFYRVRMDS